MKQVEFYDREGSAETRYFSSDSLKRHYHLKRFLACTEVIQRHLTPGARVMDLGPGEGMFTSWLTKRGTEVVACDLSRAYLIRVKRRAPGCDVVLCSAEALPIRSKSIHVTLAVDVLEHVPRLDRAISEVGRVTAQSLVISMPVNSFYRRFAALIGVDLSRYDNEVGHLHVLRPSVLMKLLAVLEVEGLRQVSLTRLFSLVPGIAKIIPTSTIRQIVEDTILRIFQSSNHLIIVYKNEPDSF